MSDRRCETCEYWRRLIAGSSRGCCRRYPPQAISEAGATMRSAQDEAKWPQPLADDWCGEFELAIRKKR